VVVYSGRWIFLFWWGGFILKPNGEEK
jgi:hypothetical protein